MGLIAMHVSNTRSAFEALLHVFRLQVYLGYDILTLSIKHRDCTTHWVRGDVNTVLRDDSLIGMEYHDIIMLEHDYNLNSIQSKYIDSSISLQTLIEMYSDIKSCCVGKIPRSGGTALVLFKEEPMSQYTLLGNSMISNVTPSAAAGARILNNICGRLTCDVGLSYTMKL